MNDKFKNINVKINGNVMEIDLEVLLEFNVNTISYNHEWPEIDNIPVNSDPIGGVVEEKTLQSLTITRIIKVSQNTDDVPLGSILDIAKSDIPPGYEIFDFSQIDRYFREIEKALKEEESIVPIKNGVYDPYVESYKKWKKDQKDYEEMMKSHLIVPEGKKFDLEFEAVPKEIVCDCGTFAVYGKVPLNAHSNYCKLVTDKNE